MQNYCFSQGKCLEWSSSSQNITINVGQNFSIPCELVTENTHINQCFQFGIKYHNRGYIEDVKITKIKRLKGLSPKFSIKYWYNITNARINDTGVYSCYYNRNFLPENLCPKLTTRQFSITVRGKFVSFLLLVVLAIKFDIKLLLA